MSKRKTQPAVVKVKRGITRKEQVAIFLDKKPFRNSRVAFREFKAINPTVAVKQTYFYTLFKSFGVRVKKGSSALTFMSSHEGKNPMTAYKTYVKGTYTEAPVSFGYFLTLWRRHFKVTGYIRRKPKAVKAPKIVVLKTVELSTLSAKEIIAKANELLKTKAKVLPTNLKNKTKIVKSATELFKAAGYQVA